MINCATQISAVSNTFSYTFDLPLRPLSSMASTPKKDCLPRKKELFSHHQKQLCHSLSSVDKFPIRPAFSATFNKCQCQTLGQIGVYLPSPVFSHGQLYVRLSRARTLNSITLLLPDLNFTDNIVYKRVLQ